jgi:lantibiotic modifying enzyme
MRPSRREFLSHAALTAAATGLWPALPALLVRARQSDRPFLDMALRCARWIDASAQTTGDGVAWPADPLKPAAIGLDAYNGMPGVISFFARLWHATGDERWRERARLGGDYLIAESRRQDARLADGLYTGGAGLAATFHMLAELRVAPAFGDAARAMTDRLRRRGRAIDGGIEWTGGYDIIGGAAGIGLWLLQAAATWKDPAHTDLAVRAGRRLLAAGQPSEGGLMWFPAPAVTRNYPNFSHGTAGVAYFLATLYQHTKDQAFLDGALAGAKYLDAVATRRNGARAIFHVTGGGENRFYLSWCHGPVGTARLFYRLFQITADRRHRSTIDELTAWVLESGAPEQSSDGYWNNISQCCGDVGIGQYCLDLARTFGLQSLDALRSRVVAHLRARAADDAAGLRWVQAEHRVQPENLVAQTGFMQGAAGVGTFFLQLDAFARGVSWQAPWPDTPWAV